ncbi:unnamed protein product [Urochloa humidicola]
MEHGAEKQGSVILLDTIEELKKMTEAQERLYEELKKQQEESLLLLMKLLQCRQTGTSSQHGAEKQGSAILLDTIEELKNKSEAQERLYEELKKQQEESQLLLMKPVQSRQTGTSSEP